MKQRFWNISIALLYGVLIALMIQLYFTYELRVAYAQALMSKEEQLIEELKNEVAYLNSQVPYLSPHLNHKNLSLKYCESLPCIDSLERQFQQKKEASTIVKSKSLPFLYLGKFSHWDKLKSIFRLKRVVDIYTYDVMAPMGMYFRKFMVINGIFSEPLLGSKDYYHPDICNNLLSINDGPFIKGKPFSSLWFTVPHSDTLKLTYFKDNYSYGYGRDSIIKRYVYDISDL